MRIPLNGRIVDNDSLQMWRFFGFSATCPNDFRQQLDLLKKAGNQDKEIILEVNSPGGSVYAGFEIYSILRQVGVPVRAEIQSIAASAASVVVAAADTVAISPVGQIMIHLPTTRTAGNQHDHTESLQMLDAITDSILNAYIVKSNGKASRHELRRMMDKETFLTAQQALKYGLVDEIIGADANTVTPQNNTPVADPTDFISQILNRMDHMDGINAAPLIPNIWNAFGSPNVERLRSIWQKVQEQEHANTATAPQPTGAASPAVCPDDIEKRQRENQRAIDLLALSTAVQAQAVALLP